MNNEYKFPYKWTLADANFTKDRGKVFSCFACGGGSTMGYKLAGFDVIGCNEIDPQMNQIYVENHRPKLNFCCDIRDMLTMDLPKELYQLDILDGSPPCSTFSTAGIREQSWGKEKKFREGQQKQVLDTLFFDFIALAKKLRPKVVVAENVRGILLGNAKKYAYKIHTEFDKAGYYCQHFLVDAQRMGVPQRRERTFFLCIRKDISQSLLSSVDIFNSLPFIDMNFNEDPILYGLFSDNKGQRIKGQALSIWEHIKEDDTLLSDACKRVLGKNHFFTWTLAREGKILPTLTAHIEGVIPTHKPNYLSEQEVKLASSFPVDYDFGKCKPHYICGMSVPPVMMAQVASRVWEYWLSKIK